MKSRFNQSAPAGVVMRQTGVFVEKPRLFEDMVIPGDESPNKPSRFIRTQIIESSPSISKGQGGSPHSKYSADHGNKAAVVATQVIDLKKAPKNDNPHAEAVEAHRARKEQKFSIIMSNVEKATSFLDEVDREMQLVDEAKRNKVRRQFEDWNTNVHGEIQKRIQSTVTEMDSKQLNRRKNKDYQKFLNVTNHKAAIFRDIIIESEYDPLEPNRNCVKATTSRLQDPVKISEIKAEKEGSMLKTGSRKSTKKAAAALGKDTLDVQQWASGKIEATPYGTFAKMMSSSGHTSGEESQKSLTMQSHIFLDHFDYPKGRDAIDSEMPKGKRVFPTTVYSDPSRVFGHLPPAVEQEIAKIRPPENRRAPIDNIFTE